MSKRQAVSRFFRAVWTGVDGVRKILHLVLLLFIFAIVFGALSATTPRLPQQAALIIRPVGELVEQLEGDPYDRAIAELLGEARPETLMQDLIDGLEYARHDDRITAVVLELDDLGSAGLSKLRRLGAALEAFRESGKPVIAMSGSYGQESYYLAAHADETYMHPEGILFLQGFGVYQNYFNAAIEKLRIDWNVFKVGTHKSAVEPFTRDSMSDEDRESMRQLVGQFWSLYRGDVERARGLAEGTIDDLVDNLLDHLAAEGSLADVALSAGLVDELLTRQELRDRVATYAGEDPDSVEGYRSTELKPYLAQMRLMRGDPSNERNVGVIVAAGEIRSGTQPPGTIGGESTAELLRRAREDESVAAVVLRVDSPGGSAFASEVILNEVQALQAAGKPVVASMSSVAASGGYWISMAADQIFASPATITGSIGIFGMFPTFQRSLEAIGISTDGVGTTKWAGELRFDRNMSEDAKALFQAVIEEGYRDFIVRVSLYRDMSEAEVDALAQGKVWTGMNAIENGLIDELGDLDEAVAAAASLTGLEPDEYGRKYFEKELTPTEQLALQFLGSVSRLGVDTRGLFEHRSSLEELAARIGDVVAPLARFNDPNGIYAHCLCRSP